MAARTTALTQTDIMLHIIHPHQMPDELPKGFVLLVDKPLGWTSFDVVNKIRYFLSKRMGVKRVKLGHAGTLDPLATGLLILCAGEYTRRIEEFQGQEKAYTGTMTFGAVTACYDLEKPVEPEQNPVVLSPEQLEAARLQQIGDIDQYPPVFSAVKVDGKRLYTNARKGNDIELQPRKVQITQFDLSPLRPVDPATIRPEPVNLAGKGHPIWCYPDYPDGLQADFDIVCGKGTYIRSMAFDMGQLTGCGAYLSRLRRTRIGAFRAEDAWSVEDLTEAIKAGIVA
jgi:tRNA pseudouridine55 synthase